MSANQTIAFTPRQHSNGMLQHIIFSDGTWMCSTTGMMFVTAGTVHVMYRVVTAPPVSGVRCARFRVSARWGALKAVLLPRTCMGPAHMLRVTAAGVSVIRAVGATEMHMVLDGDLMRWVCEPPYVHNRCNIAVVYGTVDQLHLDCMMPLYLNMVTDPNRPDDDGVTPLMHAIRHKCAYVTERLLYAHCVDVTVADKQGRTALHWAVLWDQTLVGELMSRGASVNVGGTCTPMDMIFTGPDSEHRAAMALTLMASMEPLRMSGATLRLVMRHMPQLANTMLLRGVTDKDAIVTEMCRYGYTSLFHNYAQDMSRLPPHLHIACLSMTYEDCAAVHKSRSGYEKAQCAILRELQKEYNYDVNALDRLGNCGLWYALRNRNTIVCQYMMRHKIGLKSRRPQCVDEMIVYAFLCEDPKTITLFARQFDIDKHIWFAGKLRTPYHHYKEMAEGNAVFTAYVLNNVLAINSSKTTKPWSLSCMRGTDI
ncbi:hypothetical protein ORF 534L [Red seabream iridovirus]|uniref:Ankyrin repeat containing protein n=3 Tax=Infectious spleen and kidney necrosis virus TaxID=180170 RepID=A0A3Q9EG00_ISKNV|nr:ankyrin repeat containing protein [Pompano iridovirus]QQA04091.1 ankyrin repeat-containing protein [Large yellow croaker iridovirus]UNA01374.1 hypothetical protein [Red seabream iridovirus]WDW26037.2 ankyrin repeat containing protein [Megalocytivirus FD201807]AZQ20955.1 ankyrin repeat containing protein [Pompano iridovirus]